MTTTSKPRTHLAVLLLPFATLAGCGGSDEDGPSGFTGPSGAGGSAGAPFAGGQAGSIGTPNGGAGSGGSPVTTPEQPAPTTLQPPAPIERSPIGGTPNLFTDVLGRTPAEVEAKARSAVNSFFGLSGNDPTTPTLNGGARSFYTLPQDPSLGFVWAADSFDIRSEGMSYGMFIAVQMDMQEQFDQLWRFAQTFMQYGSTSALSSWRHYFRWRGSVDTSNPNSWAVNYMEEPPASDGEEYFAAALYLANRRWGSGGAIDYKLEADALSDAMLNNPAGTDGRFPLFHAVENQVTFVPFGSSYEHSDPSYHLPAFYEIFAEDGPAENKVRWRVIAEESRAFFVESAHPVTGLHPDYARFDGTPEKGYNPDPSQPHDQFRYDAWRVPLNMAVEYAWSRPDERLSGQIEKYLAFFGSNLANGNVSAALFNLDGSNGTGGGSQALVATLGAAALASQNESRMVFINNLWNVAQPTGQYRYYQGSVYLLGLLAASGYFDYGWE